jgi:hypothetical protein
MPMHGIVIRYRLYACRRTRNSLQLKTGACELYSRIAF